MSWSSGLRGWLLSSNFPSIVHFAAAFVWTLLRARGALRWPRREAGLSRLEQVNRLAHQPLRSLGDRLSGGAGDAGTLSLWRRHQERLLSTLKGLRVGTPRSDLPRRDPWALRAGLLLLLVVAAGLLLAEILPRSRADAVKVLATSALLFAAAEIAGYVWRQSHAIPEVVRAKKFEVVDDDMTNSIVFACKGDLLNDPAAAQVKRPASMPKDAWRQLMPTMRVIGATLELR